MSCSSPIQKQKTDPMVCLHRHFKSPLRLHENSFYYLTLLDVSITPLFKTCYEIRMTSLARHPYHGERGMDWRDLLKNKAVPSTGQATEFPQDTFLGTKPPPGALAFHYSFGIQSNLPASSASTTPDSRHRSLAELKRPPQALLILKNFNTNLI